MNFLSLLWLFSLFCKKSTIENGEYPVCKNCVYYRPSVFDLFPDKKLGKCTKYGTKDVISGCITYDYAFSCRDEKCGKKGNSFIARPDIMTFINYTIKSMSETSNRNREIWEKIKNMNSNENVEYSPFLEEEKMNCVSEEENCETEFCHECYLENSKKNSTMIVETKIISEEIVE